MADIIRSSGMDPKTTMLHFKNLVRKINKAHSKDLLSPLTITLGDEFQGVVKDLKSSIQIIVALEECIIHERVPFKLRYALNYDHIRTPINKAIAHGMLGEGLTNTRKTISEMKSKPERFHISDNNPLASEILNDAFIVFQEIIEKWSPEKDFEIVGAFLKYKDYKLVAKALERDRSVIWRRKKTLDIVSYFSIRNVITKTSLL